MPGARCSIAECGNIHAKTQHISYHNLPTCEQRKRQWCESLSMDLRRGDRVCSRHFTPDCYDEFLPGQRRRRLKRFAIPTLRTPPSKVNADAASQGTPDMIEDVGSYRTTGSGSYTAVFHAMREDALSDHAYAQQLVKQTRSTCVQVNLHAETCSIGVQMDPDDFLAPCDRVGKLIDEAVQVCKHGKFRSFLTDATSPGPPSTSPSSSTPACTRESKDILIAHKIRFCDVS